MKEMKKLFALIPTRILVKYLPQILAVILTKVLTWLFKTYPSKAEKTIQITQEVIDALMQNVEAASDGIIRESEVNKGIELWKKAFD